MTTTTTRQPEWLAALSALVPAELRDELQDITQQLRSLHDASVPICERALEIQEELATRTRSTEREMVEVVGEEHRDEVADAAWKIMNAISGETEIVAAMYTLADIFGIAAETGSVEAFRKQVAEEIPARAAQRQEAAE